MYSSYCRYSLICIEILCVCVCVFWIINVSQYSALPSAVTQRKGQQIGPEHRHSRVKQAFSKRDRLQHGCVVCRCVASVASELDWFPHSDQTSLSDQSKDRTTSFLRRQDHFCMDDSRASCFGICPTCHWFLEDMFERSGLMPLPAAPVCWSHAK